MLPAEVVLASRVEHYPDQVVGGEQQRVAMTRARVGMIVFVILIPAEHRSRDLERRDARDRSQA